MITVTTDFVPGKDVTEALGVVQGSTIQSKHLGKDITAGLKTIIGGELKGYSEMLQEAREIALTRMIADAEQKGADAVINIRFATSSIMAGAAEILAYGTAVRLTDNANK